MIRRPPRSTLFPYTPLSRSQGRNPRPCVHAPPLRPVGAGRGGGVLHGLLHVAAALRDVLRSEEHTSELQSPCNLVCRLLLEKKKKKIKHDCRLNTAG